MVQVRLPRIQLDDELFVDDRLHLFARWDVSHFTAERITIRRQPIRHGGNLSELKIAKHELTRLRLVLNRDFVACFHVVGSDIDAAPFTSTWPCDTSWRAALRVLARPRRYTTLSSRVSRS